MDVKYLTISYDCLSAIGNSFVVESMMGEVIMSFYEATEAFYIAYYQDSKSLEPLVKIGQSVPYNLDVEKKDTFLQESTTHFHIFLPLRFGYMVCVYKKREDIGRIYAIIRNLTKKINFALSACAGVKELEELNNKLEERVSVSVQKIREHEQMLFAQSKSAIMGEMVAMIAHQWRQPITSIGMIANNILLNLILSEDETFDRELFEKEVEDINKQVVYLSQTIDDFRGFFKESKKREAVELDEFLHKSTSLLQKQLEQNGIELCINNSCQNMVLKIYKNELTQVVLNLLNNARDAFETHNSADKKITISCFMLDENVKIEFCDNAGGIEQGILEKIFEPYFSTKKEKNGTGLGLYMSKIILEKHLGATIEASNRGEGAVFSITLPMHTKE